MKTKGISSDFKGQLAAKAKQLQGTPTYRHQAASKPVLSGDFFNPKKNHDWMMGAGEKFAKGNQPDWVKEKYGE